MSKHVWPYNRYVKQY